MPNTIEVEKAWYEHLVELEQKYNSTVEKYDELIKNQTKLSLQVKKLKSENQKLKCLLKPLVELCGLLDSEEEENDD